MKKIFPGYYRPSDDEFKKMWENCLFVLDANVILNLYRYSKETSDELISILKKISDRLWIPHQAALEYHERRVDVILKQKKAYEEIEKVIMNAQKNLENALRSYKRHPIIEVDSFLKKTRKAFSIIEKELDTYKQKHIDLFDNDYPEKEDIKNNLTNILDGKVGKPYSQEELENRYKIGEKRYKNKIPPGYADEKKEETKKYNDLIIWFQIIDKATQEKKPIILVTDDMKEDWWLRIDGRIISPRPELIDEMHSKAGISSYIYQADQFMKYAVLHLKSAVKKESINEVEDLRRRDEDDIVIQRDIDTATSTLERFALINTLSDDVKRSGFARDLVNYSNVIEEAIKQGGVAGENARNLKEQIETASRTLKELFSFSKF